MYIEKKIKITGSDRYLYVGLVSFNKDETIVRIDDNIYWVGIDNNSCYSCILFDNYTRKKCRIINAEGMGSRRLCQLVEYIMKDAYTSNIFLSFKKFNRSEYLSLFVSKLLSKPLKCN